ncbi:hypothetical protein RD1_3184 [Roseobacter denitrificans OCh 114]|uniref:Uncharacterized protein n=1 Tax=Roseobacter denitrificans (strain ATCC 33942 / OCh 114) TaxID=375451 RepID=Q164A3_ROSDO|nr:hypothetical protein RD1_3184 [Roseobacter denitrificans OCh 114]
MRGDGAGIAISIRDENDLSAPAVGDQQIIQQRGDIWVMGQTYAVVARGVKGD